VNLLGDNIDAIKKNMETLIDASKEVGLEVNTEKTKYMLLSRHRNAGQSHDIKKITDVLKMWQSSDIWEQL
jgi:UDP-N-acetylglucosamine 2-epimerase